MVQIRKVKVYNAESVFCGTCTVSIVEELPDNRIVVRVWFGTATPTGWEPWSEWDGHMFPATRDQLMNPRVLELFKEET